MAHLEAIRAAEDVAELAAIAGLPAEEARTRDLAENPERAGPDQRGGNLPRIPRSTPWF